jgi:transposase
LSGIRERVTVRHEHRYERHSWAFFQLRQFLTYKAAWAGVQVYLVDPRNTSRTCSRCGHCEQANRKSQESFLCQRCGFATNADYNAAINISRKQWAAVNRPMASPPRGVDASPRLSPWGCCQRIPTPRATHGSPAQEYCRRRSSRHSGRSPQVGPR